MSVFRLLAALAQLRDHQVLLKAKWERAQGEQRLRLQQRLTARTGRVASCEASRPACDEGRAHAPSAEPSQMLSGGVGVLLSGRARTPPKRSLTPRVEAMSAVSPQKSPGHAEDRASASLV